MKIAAREETYAPASKYARAHWEEHWLLMSELHDRLEQTPLTPLQDGLSSDVIGLVAASYALMDFDVLVCLPEDAIEYYPPGDLPPLNHNEITIAQFLRETAMPVGMTKAAGYILRALALWYRDTPSQSNFQRVIRDAWSKATPPLPPLESCHSALASIASRHIIGSGPRATSQADYAKGSGFFPYHLAPNKSIVIAYFPAVFCLSFMSWAEHVANAFLYNRREIHMRTRLRDPWDRDETDSSGLFAWRIMRYLLEPGSKRMRDRFVNSVEEAIRAVNPEVEVRSIEDSLVTLSRFNEELMNHRDLLGVLGQN